MGYYMAIDAGGTKTEAVLIDDKGHLVRRLVRRGCNPMDYGIEDTYAGIFDIVKEMADGVPEKIQALYGGIAGLNRIRMDLESYLAVRFPVEHIRMEADGFSIISGMLGHADGCGMVCGTGSSLFIRIEGKPPADVGGLGYLIDTGGSGFELARDGLKEAYRYLDGRGPYTLLADLLEKALGKDLRSAFQDLYRGGRTFIASLAHVVFEGAEQNDETSRRILDEGAERLAELTFAAAHHFEGRFNVVMNGGILKAYPNYAKAVKEKAASQANMICSEVPPVYGGCVEALWDCGITASEEMRQVFMEDYQKFA